MYVFTSLHERESLFKSIELDPQLPMSLTMQPKKKKLITKSISQSSSPMARYLSSSSSSSAPAPTASLIDLTSSPPPTTMSASTSQRDGGRTSYIWAHGKKIVCEGKDRWECRHCKRSYAICGSATTNQ